MTQNAAPRANPPPASRVLFPQAHRHAVPDLAARRTGQARRFTWLLDILYDHRVTLLASAAVPADALYPTGPHAGEFPRTASRLTEMHTRDYMALPHITDGAGAEVA